MSNKLTFQEQLTKFNKIHNNFFTYDDSSYVNTTTKMKIICPIHGDFLQTPTQHKRGTGCPKCRYIKNSKRQTLTFKEQLPKFNKIHNNKYTYDESTYVNTTTKMRIICPVHGEFWQLPEIHKRGSGCPQCAIFKPKRTKDINELITEFNIIHNNKYKYDLTTYINTATKMRIICPKHGEFWQTPNNHKNNHGCKLCAIEERAKNHTMKFNDFIKYSNKIHNNKYIYKKSSYKNATSKVSIICPIHGEFSQLAINHYGGQGCPKCNRSQGELKIINTLHKYNIKFIEEKKFKDCRYKKCLPFDFYLPELNVCIEYDGVQHYEFLEYFYKTIEEFYLRQLLDKIKNNYCFVKKIKLIRIPYWKINEIDDIITSCLNIY